VIAATPNRQRLRDEIETWGPPRRDDLAE